MLSLSRRSGESVYVGETLVTVVRIKKSEVKLVFDAPPEVKILRKEIAGREPADPPQKPG